MIYKIIPNTDLSLSVISLGTWLFGGDVWGNAAEQDCIKTVNAAIDSGINLIDTAPIYGHGRSETIVGKAIGSKRSKIILATKCGLKMEKGVIINDLSPKAIKNEIEDSLRRLQVDYIDIYQCHWPDQKTPIEETMGVMSALKKEGKIRYIGLSNHTKEQIREALAYADIATLQNNYSLLERSLEDDILPFCRKMNIGIITYGSLGGGILTGKYKKPQNFDSSDARGFFYHFYDEENFNKADNAVSVLRSISQRIKKPVSQVALNWIWQKEGINSAIAGARNSEQANLNALSADWELSKADIDLLDKTNARL